MNVQTRSGIQVIDGGARRVVKQRELSAAAASLSVTTVFYTLVILDSSFCNITHSFVAAFEARIIVRIRIYCTMVIRADDCVVVPRQDL